MDISRAKKIKWTKWLKRPYNPFSVTLYFQGLGKKYYRQVGLGDFDNNCLFQDDFIYFGGEKMENNIRLISALLRKKDIFFIVKMLARQNKNNLKKIKALAKSKMDPKNKLIILKDTISQSTPYLWLTYPLDHYYESEIEKCLKPFIGENPSDYIAKSGPMKKTASERMADDIRRGMPADLVQNKYGWIKSRDGFSDFYTIKEIREIMRFVKSRREVPLAKYPVLPKKISRLCRELRELIFFRTDRTDKHYEMLGLARPILIEIADSLGIKLKELADYDVNSIISGRPRRYGNNFYYYMFIDGKETINKGKFFKTKKIHYQKVSGLPVQRGKAVGRAKIILSADEIGKLKQGDILVAQMTFPSFIIGMKKAKAFVTDEGGITCHAAIVAREMKKPCVTATKIATQVFKDGDLIEVDADKGIVRKIK